VRQKANTNAGKTQYIITIAILAILIIIIYPHAKKNIKFGAFEYVRKGRTLIEQKKFARGLSDLNKAYHIAPNNQEVLRNLVYAHIDYAGYLSNKGELDKAIRVLLDAYQINSKAPQIVQVLSIFYAKKAIQKSETNNFREALDLLGKCQDLAMRSKKIRKGVSAYLFNSGIAAFQRDDRTTALLCLKSSYALWKRFETIVALSQFYYRDAKPEMAKFYLEKAHQIRPDDKEVINDLIKVNKDLEARSGMIGIDSDHFKIQLHEDYDIDTIKVAGILQKIYRDVGKDLGYYPEKNTKIIFYSEEDFTSIFDHANVIQGFFDGSIKMPIRTGISQPEFIALAAHEYTHAVVSILTDMKSPLWINEGIACFEQSRYEQFATPLLKQRHEQKDPITLKEIENGFRTKKIILSYQASYALVLFMKDTWGWSGIKGLLSRIRDDRHYINAIDEEFYVSVKVFEKMFNEYLQTHLNH